MKRPMSPAQRVRFYSLSGEKGWGHPKTSSTTFDNTFAEGIMQSV